MAIAKQTVRYDVDGTTFEAVAKWDDAVSGPRPAVLIAPTFMDKSAFEEDKAEKLAALGYVGFAIDLFGVDIQPTSFEEAGAAMTALNADRKVVAARMLAALAQARALPVTDAAKVAATGFCFGGKCVLDLARTGADVKGVVSLHGLFDPPPFDTATTIPAKVLVLHGWDDPLATPDAVVALATELTDKKADWQIHAYGHTQHGFTNYNRPDMFSADADRRSWQAMGDFLAELFG
jgi:dienelactone hydrolase